MLSTPQELRKPALPYRPEDYLSGVVQLPPWVRNKRQRFYGYSFSSTLNTPITQPNQINLEGDSFFLLEGINIVAGNLSGNTVSTLKIEFSDTSKGINWSTNSLSFPNISGRGDCSKILSHPTLFKPSSTILFSLNNNPSNVPVYGVLFGRKIFDLTTAEADFLLRRAWYQYDVLAGPVAGGQTLSFPVQTAVDSDFYLWKFESSEGLFFNRTTATLTCALRDVTTNKNIFSGKAGMGVIAGGQYTLSTTLVSGTSTGKPFCLSIPRRISRNSTIVLDISNLSASATDIFGPANFTLEGVRVF